MSLCFVKLDWIILREIIEGDIDENYFDFVSVLEIKRKFVLEKKQGVETLKDIPSLDDLVPILQKLQTVVCLVTLAYVFLTL